ncbi:MAG: beta-ureidopropionase / N-carbamoyl-L-amino-acid hydrolase [Streptosporangiaceae bacterium]|nr:amidase, hydantoinase/carbamoylase family [Streptosporangiaceae bacterium]MDX6432825.1 beta-ureidopropionase / N-carbamoyl-L-amino-acid hydrolase [Streptosporangiaceae bacterium]
MWAALLPIGRDAATGGYHRFAWTPAELDCRAWFLGEAAGRGMELEQDRNGNLFAWWNPAGAAPGLPGGAGVVTGSHLDSVPGGGAFDGPLGVVSALAAIDLMRARDVRPVRAIGVAVFAEEEGARFGVACLGSRLLTGAIDPRRARDLRDAGGIGFGEALARDDGGWAAGSTLRPGGLDPAAIGRDEELLSRIGCFVELHVEQGRAMDAPVGVASAIWPHGRWRFDFAGHGNHAGTTRLGDRRDPMLPFAHTVIEARAAAERHDSLATVGKVTVVPGGVNAIPSRVTAWLDARGPDDRAVRRTVEEIGRAAELAAEDHGVTVRLGEESYTAVVAFNTALRDRLADVIASAGSARPPVLPTGAGHDAGILSAHLPTAMLFVRNPTGVSHAPEEHAEVADCLAGVEALAAVLQDLACDESPEQAHYG